MDEKITMKDLAPDFLPDELDEAEGGEGFKITDDSGAEWALRKIAEIEEEKARLLDLYEQEKLRLAKAAEKVAAQTEAREGYFKALLRRYFDTVPHTTTKAGTEQYKLLSGTLALKPGGPRFVPDKEKLLAWLDQNGREDLITTWRSPKWAEVKKTLTYAAGCAVDENGQIVDGVEVVNDEPTFIIKQ